MTTFIGKIKNASKMQIRDVMLDIELKLASLRDTPYSDSAVDEETIGI